jgi:hypothetical protein
MRRAAVATTAIFLLLSACSSSDAPSSGEDFRAEFQTEMLQQIEAAELPADLRSLAISSMTTCLADVAPSGPSEITAFTSCYSETLCASDLVEPVWEGDTASCVAEAEASFDLGS